VFGIRINNPLAIDRRITDELCVSQAGDVGKMLGVATASGYAGLTVVCRLASPGRRNSPAFLFIGDGFFALGVDDNTAASLAA
jgi:hypothetical protein